MNNSTLKQAIEHDLKVLPTLKMGEVTAAAFYYPMMGLTLKTSGVFLLFNTLMCLLLKSVGLFPPPIDGVLLLISWGFALLLSCLVRVKLSQFRLISLFLKGRLKTEAIIKAKYRHFIGIFFLIYGVVYLLIGACVNAGIPEHEYPLAIVFFFFGFVGFFALIAGSVISTLMFGAELERMGLGILYNKITAVYEEVKNRHMTQTDTHDGSNT